MKVYKFGGASVKSADGIKNIVKIIQQEKGSLFIVISAMGKTTNALEVVLDFFMKGNKTMALEKLAEVEQYHIEIIQDLFRHPHTGMIAINPLLHEIKQYINEEFGDDYDKCYDQLVSYGELLSTSIISAYIFESGYHNHWLDMRKFIVTDSNFREANVKMEESAEKLRVLLRTNLRQICIGQGFIGANSKGKTTTLGREGSDYTAAVVANLMDAESVTIWKDVPGVLNADPKFFEDVVKIPELTYLDAVELAYSGAQIIHPKTIRPLENKKIPLYVKPFHNPEEEGSVIKDKIQKAVDIPVLILRKNQILVTMRPKNFSFVLEESLSKIFMILHKNRMKVSLIQSSAVSISICLDNNRYIPQTLDELSTEFKVSYNEKLELLNIRGINKEIIKKTTEGREILLTQKTRRIGRFLMREL